MNIRNILLAGATVLAFATPAMAQSGANAPAGTLTVIKNDDTMVQPFNLRVDKLEGMDVIGANGEEIGEVEDVLADSSGKAVAVSIDAGSFLQMNQKEIIMQLSALQHRDGKLHTTMTKDQISALPDHKD